MRAKTLEISSIVDFGYLLIDASEIVPSMAHEKAAKKSFITATVVDKSGRLNNAAKQATKSIDLDHKMFSRAYKLIQQLKEFTGCIQNYHTFLEEDLKSRQEVFDRNILVHGKAFETIYGEKMAKEVGEFAAVVRHVTKMKDLTALLSAYYRRYMALVIEEFGDASIFSSGFPTAEACLLALAQLVRQKRPLLVAEKRPTISFPSMTTKFSSGTSCGFGIVVIPNQN